MLLRHSLRLETEAAVVEQAVHKVLQQGHRTKDLAAKDAPWVNTSEMGRLVIAALG
jgi:3-isopropylmalate dehydrogenase